MTNATNSTIRALARMGQEGMRTACASWLSSQELECFYEGVRTDCAHALGIAPNRQDFHAAWDCMEVWISGPGIVRAS